MMKVVTGIIIRRKSFGKCLAFVTLKVDSIIDCNDISKYNTNHDNVHVTPEQEEDEKKKKKEEDEVAIETTSSSTTTNNGIEILIIHNEKIPTIRIVFQRKSKNWDKTFDNTFPIKNSLLPYGAKIKVLVKKREPDEKSGCNYEVCSWEIIDDPRLIALEKARCNPVVGEKEEEEEEEKNDKETEGLLLHEYLKSRGLFYLQYNDVESNKKMKEQKRHNNSNVTSLLPSSTDNNAATCTASSTTTISTSSSIHGDKHAKSLRAKIFASWLINEFGINLLSQNQGVLDVAGGKGQLSIELSITAAPNLQCTVIDPFIRGRSAKGDIDNNKNKFVPNKVMKRIQKVHGRSPLHVAQYFRKDNQESNDLVAGSGCVVGLHPDQPTEDIVDLALLYNKPFACIPCCVFPGIFTMRYLSSGKFVQSYEDFIQYLLEKDGRIKTTTLNFEGKNRVIYFKG